MPESIHYRVTSVPSILVKIVLTLVALPFSAAGQTNTDGSSTGMIIEEMIVSAQKKDESIQDVAISIKALSTDTIEKLGVENMEDISRLVPSLSISGQKRGANNIQIRGLGSNISASSGTVAIYTDGIISSASLAGRGGQFEADSSIFDTDRIEVLRGPQGTLYGEGSFGGVISIFSTRPQSEYFESTVTATLADTQGAGDLNTRVSAMVNVPLIENVLAVRATGTFVDDPGFIDTFIGTLNPVPFVSDANSQKIKGGRLSIGFTPTDSFDATLILKAERADLGFGGTDSPQLLSRYNSLVNPNSAGPSEINTNEAILEINYETPIGTLTSVTGYSETENTELLAATTQFRPGKAYSEELRFGSSLDGPVNWIVGAYFRKAEGVFDIETLTAVFPVAEYEQQQWSVFGQLYWDITDALTATFGARYGQQDSAILDGFPLLIGGAAAYHEASFDNFSPKIALDWRINDSVLVYVSYAEGFRPGGFNLDQSGLAADPAFILEFEPDEVANYETGLKTNFWDDRVTFNSAVFYIDWTDTLIEQFLPLSEQNIAVNAGDAHSLGVETDIVVVPADGWLISFGGSLIEAEMDSGIGSSGAPLKGDRLPLGPRYTLNASVEKTIDLSSIDSELYLRADYSLRDGAYADVPNDPTLLGASAGSTYLSSSFDVFNFRSGLRSDSWEIQIFVNNLFDEYEGGYNLFAFGLDFHAVSQPRTVGAMVRYHFQTL